MISISEFVSVGHPDKVADYISEYLLDRYLEQDPDVRYAVEVQIKGFHVTLAGEVTSKVQFDQLQIENFVKKAVNEIGTRRNTPRSGDRKTRSSPTHSMSRHISRNSLRT